jgi:hypothetical protein
MPYSAFRVFHIAFAAGNEMNVQVKDGLTGVFALVDANIEPGDCWIFLKKSGALLLNKLLDSI